MSFSILKHGNKCGGTLIADATHLFSIRTPSISYGPGGITLGVVEITLDDAPTKGMGFICEKCGTKVLEDFSNVVVRCLACETMKKINEMYTSSQIPAICEECVTVLTVGYEGAIPPSLRYVSNWMSIPKNVPLKKFEEILKSEITF